MIVQEIHVLRVVSTVVELDEPLVHHIFSLRIRTNLQPKKGNTAGVSS